MRERAAFDNDNPFHLRASMLCWYYTARVRQFTDTEGRVRDHNRGLISEVSLMAAYFLRLPAEACPASTNHLEAVFRATPTALAALPMECISA